MAKRSGKLICFKRKSKAKAHAKARRSKGKRAHVRVKKALYCVVAGKRRKSRKSR